jgi:4-hydroxybenzoate polyprenyltransferase
MIKNLKLFFKNFVYSGQLFPLGAVSIIFASASMLNIRTTWDCLAIIYLGIYIPYLFNRYKEIETDYLTNPERTKFFQKNIKHIPFVILFLTLLLVIVFFTYSNRLPVIIFGALLLVFSILYTVFLKQLTKKIPGFKNIFIGLVWALLVIFLTAYYQYPVNLAVILIYIFIFMRCFMGTSFYDIKDIESDGKQKLLTLAIIFGKEKLLKFLQLVNVFSSLPILWGVYAGLLPFFSLTILLLIPITSYLLNILGKEEKNISFLSEILIGAEKFSWAIIILIAKLLC